MKKFVKIILELIFVQIYLYRALDSIKEHINKNKK